MYKIFSVTASTLKISLTFFRDKAFTECWPVRRTDMHY